MSGRVPCRLLEVCKGCLKLQHHSSYDVSGNSDGKKRQYLYCTRDMMLLEKREWESYPLQRDCLRYMEHLVMGQNNATP